jgi:branched-chain amino acid aminotransferase
VGKFESMANVDGVITNVADARVPIMDRGFLYGDSIYEVFRTYRGIPLFHDEHWARFERSAKLAHLTLTISKDQIINEIRKTVRATNAAEQKRDVYVRYIVTRGEGPVDLFPRPELTTRYVIIVKELPEWDSDFLRVGIRLAIPETRRNATNALDPNIKGGNYMNNVLGIIEARMLGADDCVMLSDSGLITEASTSNVFFVMRNDNTLVTPAETAGHLRGLTKAAVEKLCVEHDLQLRAEDITMDLLLQTSECFLTSSTREVMPVSSLRLPNGNVMTYPDGGGNVTKQVIGHYKAFIDGHLQDHEHLRLF